MAGDFDLAGRVAIVTGGNGGIGRRTAKALARAGCAVSIQIVLDKGQEDDWFNSPFIVVCTVVAGLSFLAFVSWELARDDPIVDIRLIGHRNFGASFGVMLAVGAVLFGTTQLMPQLVAGQVSRFIQPRWMMAGALISIAPRPASLHRPHAGSRVLVVRLGARLADGGPAVPVPDRHQLFLRRPAAQQIGGSVGP